MELPLIARVECRSEGAPEERAVAVWIGGRRVAVREILEDVLLGGRSAGQPTIRRVRVELDDGERLRLMRTLPDGEWRVMRLEE